MTTNRTNYFREWRETHPEKVAEYNRKWRENHPEKIRENNQKRVRPRKEKVIPAKKKFVLPEGWVEKRCPNCNCKVAVDPEASIGICENKECKFPVFQVTRTLSEGKKTDNRHGIRLWTMPSRDAVLSQEISA